MATEKIKMRRGSARVVQRLAGAILLGDGRMGVYIRTSLILVKCCPLPHVGSRQFGDLECKRAWKGGVKPYAPLCEMEK